jgi:hypothetical protein
MKTETATTPPPRDSLLAVPALWGLWGTVTALLVAIVLLR